MEQLRNIIDRYVGWSVVVLFAISYAAYAYFNQDLSEVEAGTEKIGLIEQRIKNTARKIEEAKAFQKEIDKRREELAELEKQFISKKAELPRSFNVQELLDDLFREAEQVGVEIKNVTPGASDVDHALYASRDVKIEIRGTFVQLFIFLDRLAKLKRLVGVGEFTFTPAGSEQVSLKGTPVGQTQSRKLSGGDRKYRLISGQVIVLSYRVK